MVLVFQPRRFCDLTPCYPCYVSCLCQEPLLTDAEQSVALLNFHVIPQREICCFLLQLPAVFVSNYKSAATFSTKSCQLAKNITTGFSKVLYSGGDDVTYASIKDFTTALTNGDFVLGMTPTQRFVEVGVHHVQYMYRHAMYALTGDLPAGCFCLTRT